MVYVILLWNAERFRWVVRDTNKASTNERNGSLVKNMKINPVLFEVWKIKLAKRSTDVLKKTNKQNIKK